MLQRRETGDVSARWGTIAAVMLLQLGMAASVAQGSKFRPGGRSQKMSFISSMAVVKALNASTGSLTAEEISKRSNVPHMSVLPWLTNLCQMGCAEVKGKGGGSQGRSRLFQVTKTGRRLASAFEAFEAERQRLGGTQKAWASPEFHVRAMEVMAMLPILTTKNAQIERGMETASIMAATGMSRDYVNQVVDVLSALGVTRSVAAAKSRVHFLLPEGRPFRAYGQRFIEAFDKQATPVRE